MSQAVGRYFQALVSAWGAGWTKFWFTPSSPCSLGALRLVTALVALYLHATLIPDLNDWFADGGLLPVEAVRELEVDSLSNRPLRGPSYLDLLHTPSELRLAHGAGMVVLALFAAGVFSRITSVLALVVVLSTIHRAPVITSQVDLMVAMCTFYLCIAPAGASWSFDRLRYGAALAAPSWLATVGRRLLQVHLALLYATMGLSKLLSDVWWNGEGVWWLISRTESRLVDLTSLHSSPLLINAWTHAIVAFELAYALLIWNRLARPLLIAWSVVHWLGIGLLTNQLPLAIMMIAANLAFIEHCLAGAETKDGL